jgi:exodeoxyribonuclease VII large subunit
MNFADGVQVQLQGSLTVYEPRGNYQIIVRRIQERGVGALQAKFEELKCRLDAEGLFDSTKKRPLPKFPRRIGVVTSPTGAAIQDFLNVLHRRQRGIEVVICPVRVQGKGAAAEIAEAATLAITATRATLRAGWDAEYEAATAHELAEQARLRETADFREGTLASRERRQPRFIGA